MEVFDIVADFGAGDGIRTHDPNLGRSIKAKRVALDATH
jgi:hypothetical protein